MREDRYKNVVDTSVADTSVVDTGVEDSERGREASGMNGQPAEKTFTQAEVDRVVAQRLARERREAEARIQAAREAGFAEARQLMAQEAEQRAGEELERAAAAAKEMEESLAARERDIVRRELRAQAIETLHEKKLPARLADVLDYSSDEACGASIERLEGVMRDAIREAVDARIAASRIPLTRTGLSRESHLMAQVRGVMGLRKN